MSWVLGGKERIVWGDQMNNQQFNTIEKLYHPNDYVIHN